MFSFYSHFFQNRLLPMQRDHSVILNVTKSTKGHSGEYQCVADNSIGKPVTATFTIRILCEYFSD